ncbi:MAG: hypothetical protein K9G43_08175 [Rhodobacteraceae bacterium]|nr:hypothetical protein [Paracoccaceae bacterium]
MHFFRTKLLISFITFFAGQGLAETSCPSEENHMKLVQIAGTVGEILELPVENEPYVISLSECQIDLLGAFAKDQIEACPVGSTVLVEGLYQSCLSIMDGDAEACVEDGGTIYEARLINCTK